MHGYINSNIKLIEICTQTLDLKEKGPAATTDKGKALQADTVCYN